MTNVEKILWGLVALGAIIVVSLSLPQRANHVPTRDANTLDSLKFTQPTFRTTIDTLILRETTFVRSVDTLLRTVSRLDAAGSVLHKTADSLAALAVMAHHASDSAIYWHRAYDVRTLESDSLRRALFTAMLARENEHQARITADQRAGAFETRLNISEQLNTRLAEDVGRAVECKFLWMRCPSRKAVALTGIATGVAATVLFESLRQNP